MATQNFFFLCFCFLKYRDSPRNAKPQECKQLNCQTAKRETTTTTKIVGCKKNIICPYKEVGCKGYMIYDITTIQSTNQLEYLT